MRAIEHVEITFRQGKRDRVADGRTRKCGIGCIGHHPENRKYADDGKAVPQQKHPLAAPFVRKPTARNVSWSGQRRTYGHVKQGIGLWHTRCTCQKIERSELRCIIDHRQTRSDTEQRDKQTADIAGILKAFDKWIFRSRAGGFHRLKNRAFRKFEPHIQRYSKQQDRCQKWNAPTPSFKRFGAHRLTGDKDHDNRKQKPASDRCLDPTGILAAFSVGRMFGNIDRCAAIFAAQCQPLKTAHQQQETCGPNTCGLERR